MKPSEFIKEDSFDQQIPDVALKDVHPSNSGTEDEYGMEGSYVKNQIHTMTRVLTHLEHAIGDNEDLPEWVEEKISQAKGMIVGLMDYIISEKEREIERIKGKDGAVMAEDVGAGVGGASGIATSMAGGNGFGKSIFMSRTGPVKSKKRTK